MKYFLEMQEEKNKLAGSKAVLDCEKIMRKSGYQSVLIGKQTFHRFHLYDLFFFLNCFKLNKLQAGDVLLIRFPAYISARANGVLLPALRHIRRKGVKLVFLIHDLNSIRFKEKKYKKRETNYLGIADSIIAHNEKMADYISKHYSIPKEKIVPLLVFDYLCDLKPKREVPAQTTKHNRIAIAGNLAKDKAAYIYKTVPSDHVRYLLYGVNVEQDQLATGMEYKGAFDPDELPSCLEGDFGLIWDGDSPETCGGPLGNYQRYNNPHKCSLYVASGLPVIVWKEAAIATFVEKQGIGILVGSLTEAEQRIRDLSEEEYQAMKKNVSQIGNKIRTGDYLKEALKKAESLL